MLMGPVLNHIEIYATSTHEREEQNQQIWRLFHVDLFSKNTIKKGIMNIKLMDLPITRDRNGED